MDKILIIQTAFIGDAILATAVAKKIHDHLPEAQIDFLVRKGNESIVSSLEFIHHVWVWDKKQGKYPNLFGLLKKVRNEKYKRVINLQRFFTSGLFTVFSGGEFTYGFNKNPWSRFFSYTAKHEIRNGLHETERNQLLIESFTDKKAVWPHLSIPEIVSRNVEKYQKGSYICIAPASVWFTKQFPAHKWFDFILHLPSDLQIYIIGGSEDSSVAQFLIQKAPDYTIMNLCGKLSLLESAALMKNSVMNYVNDSAPLHLCSGVNAPVRAVFCSTIPGFGFGPLSDNAAIVQVNKQLACRPCGLHGKKACPEGNFACAELIDTKAMAQELMRILNKQVE